MLQSKWWILNIPLGKQNLREAALTLPYMCMYGQMFRNATVELLLPVNGFITSIIQVPSLMLPVPVKAGNKGGRTNVLGWFFDQLWNTSKESSAAISALHNSFLVLSAATAPGKSLPNLLLSLEQHFTNAVVQSFMHRTMNSEFCLGFMLSIEILHDEKINYPVALITYLVPLLDLAFWRFLHTNIPELKVVSQRLLNSEHQQSVAKTIAQVCGLGDEEKI